MASKTSPMFVKTHDFLLWLFAHTGKFPKARRHTLTNRLENALLDFLGAAVQAQRKRGAARVAALESPGIAPGG